MLPPIFVPVPQYLFYVSYTSAYEIPVIFLTASGYEDDVKRAIDLGAVNYLKKYLFYVSYTRYHSPLLKIFQISITSILKNYSDG